MAEQSIGDAGPPVLDYCSLPGGVGWAVRLSVLWTCASVLLVKKVAYETPDRDWTAFLLDCSKQVAGAVWAFVLSAPVIGCGDLWTRTLLETTFGVFVEYLALVALSRLFRESSGNSRAFTTGEYCDSTGRLAREVYMMQLVLWLLCVAVMKFVVMGVAASYSGNAEGPAFRLISRSPEVERIMVLLVMPCVMRGLQVWLTDDFLKKDGAPGLLRLVMQKASMRRARKASPTGQGDYVAPKAMESRGEVDEVYSKDITDLERGALGAGVLGEVDGHHPGAAAAENEKEDEDENGSIAHSAGTQPHILDFAERGVSADDKPGTPENNANDVQCGTPAHDADDMQQHREDRHTPSPEAHDDAAEELGLAQEVAVDGLGGPAPLVTPAQAAAAEELD